MSNSLKQFSDALVALVKAAGPYVVQVNARRRLPASGIVWSADGVIVTAHHVVEQSENIRVGLPDGETVPGTLVGRDPTTDLAVIRAQASGLTAPAWADLAEIAVGHLVLALGRPGKTVQATLGIVSAMSQESWRTPAGGEMARYLQPDVVMYPGFSGGPLVGMDGQVIGMNTSALMRGVSLCVPAPTVKRVVEALQTHGRVRRGYLGVGAQPVRLPQRLGRQLGQETGLLLVSVEPGSPAERGGLSLGDTILAVDGQPIRHMDDLLAMLGSDRVGTQVPVRILRGGQIQELKVTIGERP